MRQAAQAAVGLGLVSLLTAVVSRLLVTPVFGIEAHAINEFSQSCFLFAIAILAVLWAKHQR